MPVLSEHAGLDQTVVEQDDHVVDLKGVALLGEPIVGVEVVTYDKNGPGVRQARPLPSPKEPTPCKGHCMI